MDKISIGQKLANKINSLCETILGNVKSYYELFPLAKEIIEEMEQEQIATTVEVKRPSANQFSNKDHTPSL